MNVLKNDDTVKSFTFDDFDKAAKKAEEAVANVLAKKIKGFQFFQEKHANRFKITKR